MMEPSQGLLDSDDDLFGDGIMPRDMDPIHDQNLTTIDLTEATDVPEELKKPLGVPPKEENKIKLSKFQCVICMDDASTLTVTHCGMSMFFFLSFFSLLFSISFLLLPFLETKVSCAAALLCTFQSLNQKLTGAKLNSTRPLILCPMPTFLASCRSDQEQMSHVPGQNRRKIQSRL